MINTSIYVRSVAVKYWPILRSGYQNYSWQITTFNTLFYLDPAELRDLVQKVSNLVIVLT